MAQLEEKYKYEVHYEKIKNKIELIKQEFDEARNALIIFQMKIDAIERELNDMDEVEIEIIPVKTQYKEGLFKKWINLLKNKMK